MDSRRVARPVYQLVCLTTLFVRVALVASEVVVDDVDEPVLGYDSTSLLQTSWNVSAHYDANAKEPIAETNLSNVQSVATASEKIRMAPRDPRISVLQAVASFFATLSIVMSMLLIRRHYLVGRILTGTTEPHPRARAFLDLILAVPVLAGLSLVGLFYPELGLVWNLLETGVLAANFSKMPDLFFAAAGGGVELQLQIKADRKKLAEDDEAIALYSNPPCCCLALCIRQRPPIEQDVRRLRHGVLQLCLVLPALTIVQLVFGFENMLTGRVSSLRTPLTQPFQVLSIMIAMCCLGGIDALVHKYNPKAHSSLDLGRKQFYARTFLIGLNLFPLAVSKMNFTMGTLANGNVLAPWEEAELFRSVTICFSAFVCAITALRAFPINDEHYPEIGDERFTEAEAVLEPVRFCPFCGTESLEVEQHSLEKQTATCLTCGSSAIPAQMPVRKPVTTPDIKRSIDDIGWSPNPVEK